MQFHGNGKQRARLFTSNFHRLILKTYCLQPIKDDPTDLPFKPGTYKQKDR
jgi:hypothetical protein